MRPHATPPLTSTPSARNLRAARPVLATADLAVTLTTLQGPIRLADYVITRCVEAVVHGWDLVEPVEPDHTALGITAEALLSVLVGEHPELFSLARRLAIADMGRRGYRAGRATTWTRGRIARHDLTCAPHCRRSVAARRRRSGSVIWDCDDARMSCTLCWAVVGSGGRDPIWDWLCAFHVTCPSTVAGPGPVE